MLSLTASDLLGLQWFIVVQFLVYHNNRQKDMESACTIAQLTMTQLNSEHPPPESCEVAGIQTLPNSLAVEVGTCRIPARLRFVVPFPTALHSLLGVVALDTLLSTITVNR